MQQTTNYQLNQWEKSDRILMDDFNSDNEKIDAALKAIRDSFPVAKILDITTETGAQMVEVDVSAIDFTQYRQVDVYFQSKMALYATVTFYLNESITKEYYKGGSSDTSSGYSDTNNVSTLCGWRWDATLTNCAHIDLGMPCAGNPVVATLDHLSVGPSNVNRTVSKRSSTSIKWDHVEKLIFYCSTEGTPLPAGTNILITGVKR